MMEEVVVHETSVICSQLTPLIAREDFVKKMHGKDTFASQVRYEAREIIKILFQKLPFYGVRIESQ
jgi:hypothetical protein